ncbi:MAG: magnesium transporter, partial [Clostridia bacterium]|nr:magnesium transporter [Clostridia bacterium]
MEEMDFLLQNENEPQKIRARQLTEIINAGYHAEKLREKLSDYHAKDIADILPEIPKEQRLRLYTVLCNEELSDIFAYLDNPAEFIDELSSQKVADIIEEMSSDDAVDVLEELDEEKQKEVIELL